MADLAASGWRLRRASADDAGALSLVAGASFLETYLGMLPGADIVAHCADKSSPTAFVAWAQDEASVVVLAEHAVTFAPVGYSVLTTPDLPVPTGPADIELKRVYLLAAMHGTGLGQALMAQTRADAAALGRTRILLGTHPGNLRARRFYEKLGFQVIGERVFQVGTQRLIDPVYAIEL